MSIGESLAALPDILQSGVAYEPPAGDLESTIAGFFAEIFGIARIGANDDFFDLGGDSLLGESLATSISRYTGQEFQISLLVNHTTPRRIAQYLQKAASVLPARSRRAPIFMVHGLRGFMLPRPQFLAGLAPDQALRMFELPGIRGGTEPRKRIEDIAADYVAQLQAEHPSGPVLLGGYCGGCVVALEMAAQLAEQGRPVRQMILFDPGGFPPNVLDNLHRRRFGTNPAIARRREPADTNSWFRRQGKYLRYLFLLGRWTDGSLDEDLMDERLRYLHERKYKRHLRRQANKPNRKNYAHLNLSDEAQARFLAAFHHYLPRQFPGPVAVFSSEAYRWKFEDETSPWTVLLPRREVHVLGTTHADVINATAETGARLMQSIIDAAITRG